MINMDLDEVWEIHKNGNGVNDIVSKKRGGRKQTKMDNSMDPSRNAPQRSMSNGRRSTDKTNGWFDDGADVSVVSVRGRGHKSKSKGLHGKSKKNKNERGGGERDKKMVSISKYVEKIELQKRRPGQEPRSGTLPSAMHRGRSRSATRGGIDHNMSRSKSVSMERGRRPSIRGGIDRNMSRSRSVSMERGRGLMRNRSKSIERTIKANRSRSMERGMTRNRSSSMERGYARSRSKNRFFN